MTEDPRIDPKISQDLSGVKSQDGGTDPTGGEFASKRKSEISQRGTIKRQEQAAYAEVQQEGEIASKRRKELGQRGQMVKRQEEAADAEVQLTLQRKVLRRWFGVTGVIFVAVLVFVHIKAVLFILQRYEGCTPEDSRCFASSGVFIAVVVAPLASATIFLVTVAHATFRPRRPTEFADFGSIPGALGKFAEKANETALD